MSKTKLLLLLLLVWTGATMRAADTADAPDIGLAGAGTAENPYLLKTAADIAALANSCAGPSGATSGVNAPHYAGIYFAIDADIDMSGIEGFYGIGTAPAGSSAGISWYFAGIIDGRGHTISNMHINGIAYDDTGKALSASKTGSRGYVGLIGTLKSPGAIGNIKLDATCTVEGYTATGSLVGQLEAGAIVSDCSSAATVRNINKNSGGIIGYMKGSSTTPAMITRCTFSGKVMENYEAAGGIAGRSERAIILRCANLGEVICESFNTVRAPGKQSLGAGIAGYNYYGTVQDCLNAGRVEVSYQKAGGIVAYNSNADCVVKSCVNLGLIECNDAKYLGAVVGHNFRSGREPNFKYGVVEDCYYDAQMRGELPRVPDSRGQCDRAADRIHDVGHRPRRSRRREVDICPGILSASVGSARRRDHQKCGCRLCQLCRGRVGSRLHIAGHGERRDAGHHRHHEAGRVVQRRRAHHHTPPPIGDGRGHHTAHLRPICHAGAGTQCAGDICRRGH